LFGVVSIMNTMGFAVKLVNYKELIPTATFSAAASLIFNYAIFGFFYYLWKTLPPKDLKQGSITDMESLLKEGENVIKEERKI